MEQPFVSVGIVHTPQLRWLLNGNFRVQVAPAGGAEADAYHLKRSENGREMENTCSGEQEVWVQNGCLCWNKHLYSSLIFTPLQDTDSFTLRQVTIGIDFHWQQHQDQSFHGQLKLLVHQQQVVAINQVAVEEYLTSVIASEMSAQAGLQLLKAHAVISRSWLLSQMQHKASGAPSTTRTAPGRLIRWYDHDSHTLYDVCADDHCQRYQGITRISHPQAQQAVAETRGQVLSYQGALCDTRFSKCCGGVTERFSSCWADTDFPYLPIQADTLPGEPTDFCNTSDPAILQQVLNDFDQATTGFYRWTVSYTDTELSELVRRKSGIDFGQITQLKPVSLSPSGRIIELEITGTHHPLVVGKELEIRRWLSPTHLYSSHFTISHQNGVFTLHGRGWGHGVGLCQIGAAVMGQRGYSYTQILQHYYPETELTTYYE